MASGGGIKPERIKEFNQQAIDHANLWIDFVDNCKAGESEDEAVVLAERTEAIKTLGQAAKIFGLHVIGPVEMA